MKKKSVVTKFLSRRILLLIQLIISIVFLGYIYYLKMLPMKYYLILVGIIALLWFFMSFFIKYGIKKKKKENTQRKQDAGRTVSVSDSAKYMD